MDTCPITGLKREIIDSTSYRIIRNDENYFINHGLRFDTLINDEKFIKSKHIFAGAILNKQLSDKSHEEPYWFSITLDNWEDKLKQIEYPKNPKSKLDNLLKTLFISQKYEGEKVDISDTVNKPYFYYKHFFKSENECIFYLKSLDKLGLINYIYHKEMEIPYSYIITIEGLNYYLKLTEEGELSNKCFVAMSFQTSMLETRKAIKEVISSYHFEPIIIDESHIDSAKTINDEIIAAIKSSKFCIADFTEQRDGVYFESGFAVGLGKKVIYTCQEEWFNKSHFDTNHFPHIIYKTTEELKEKLDNKIKAWIV